jgi:NADH:ubiquinone oxidoreductase subunit H
MVVLWAFFPMELEENSPIVLFGGILIALSLVGLGLVFTGWRRRSSFGLIGSIRGLVQFVSYEIVYSFVWFVLFSLSIGYSGRGLKWNRSLFYIVFGGVLFLFFFIIILAERQRNPFDFAEGERELVSGFNTEFSSLYFALVFFGGKWDFYSDEFDFMWNFYYMSWVSFFYGWDFYFREVGGFGSKNYATFSIRSSSKINVKKNSSNENSLFHINFCIFLGW